MPGLVRVEPAAMFELSSPQPALQGWIYPLLFGTGLLAGFVDSIAGGGGVITIPVLLSVGLPPQVALGTNKLQATFGSGSAAWHFWRAGLVPFQRWWLGVAMTLVGATIGTLCVSRLNPDFLRQSIPWLLIGIALYLLVQPNAGQAGSRPRFDVVAFQVCCGLGIGFYDGFFGPGTGTFWAMAFVTCLGFDLRSATAHTKLMNFASNVASLAVFLMIGQVHVRAGLCMGVGQWCGARLGSGMVIRRGVGWVRPLFIVMALSVTARLVWLNFHRGR